METIMSLDIITELSVFNKIKYFDDTHEYYIGDQKYISATKFIGTFKPYFDSDRIAERYANKHGLLKEDVLKEWDFKRDFSTHKGKKFHDFAENYLNNKIFPYDNQDIIERFGQDDIRPVFEKLKGMFVDFYHSSRVNLIPIKNEVVVGDEELGVCGMIDQLYYNKKANELQIWDWKTNKAINRVSEYKNKMKAPIAHLDECEFNTYSLQLNLYKLIIERNTGLKVGDLYFVWFFEGNDTYQVFKCADMQKELQDMFKHFKK
jgi:ATP-dependent exoDNAse (exonuclease V) beta subunit